MPYVRQRCSPRNASCQWLLQNRQKWQSWRLSWIRDFGLVPGGERGGECRYQLVRIRCLHAQSCASRVPTLRVGVAIREAVCFSLSTEFHLDRPRLVLAYQVCWQSRGSCVSGSRYLRTVVVLEPRQVFTCEHLPGAFNPHGAFYEDLFPGQPSLSRGPPENPQTFPRLVYKMPCCDVIFLECNRGGHAAPGSADASLDETRGAQAIKPQMFTICRLAHLVINLVVLRYAAFSNVI